MKTNRSLVVIVSLITATLLLTACAQPEQSSLAGDWLLTPKDKTRGLTGSIAVNIAPSRCKTNCRGDNGNDSNLLIVFYVQIMPDDFVMQLHRF